VKRLRWLNHLMPCSPEVRHVGTAIKDLLGRARSAGATVIHIRNNGGDSDPDAPGTPGWELVHEVVPGEHTVDKNECDAFAGTGLSGLVPEAATVVVAGMQSEFCIRETSLSALRRGHAVGARPRGARDLRRQGTRGGDVPGRRVRAPCGGRVGP
jgi:nicotinamidase-related amidase